MNDRPKDDRDVRLERIFAAAKTASPDVSGVARNFETRLMARIAESRGSGEPWYGWAWRLAPAFIVLTLLLGAWTLVFDPVRATDPGTMLVAVAEQVTLVDDLTGG